MGMAKEFKEFAMKGNMLDMAIGIVIGAAFGKIPQHKHLYPLKPTIGITLCARTRQRIGSTYRDTTSVQPGRAPGARGLAARPGIPR